MTNDSSQNSYSKSSARVYSGEAAASNAEPQTSREAVEGAEEQARPTAEPARRLAPLNTSASALPASADPFLTATNRNEPSSGMDLQTDRRSEMEIREPIAQRAPAQHPPWIDDENVQQDTPPETPLNVRRKLPVPLVPPNCHGDSASFRWYSCSEDWRQWNAVNKVGKGQVGHV